MNIECDRCHRIYFYERKNRRGHTKTKCNSCSVNKRRREVKQKLVDSKGGKCEKCGYNRCLRALSFHHLDPNQKDFEINTSRASLSYEKLIVEIQKCILVCGNCHMEIHDASVA